MAWDLAENLSRIGERIAAACERAGRSLDTVRLIAATKTAPPERLRRLAAAGCREFGENRIQEAIPKIDALRDLFISDPSPLAPHPCLTWHFIGHLQSNKARSVPGRFAWLYSLDSPELARILEKACASTGARLKCLIEVNIGRESQKHGVPPEALPPLLEAAEGLAHLDIRGLMAIPPEGASPEILRSAFGGLRKLAHRHNLPELSMGMSQDFEIAIEEGATMVRIGRALLGPRLGLM